ncbi:hypothetical protein [Armatimonas sp.]|uniref:hypothetical protein n=1 Tax=Armatimonas sp. TaxID=1872638 RepID=UPI00286AC4B6|nr:hypothetical protein [Armatimonas sp.]
MSLTITLEPDVEAWVRREAARMGLDAQGIIQRTLRQQSHKEQELLIRIQNCFPEDQEAQLRQLAARRGKKSEAETAQMLTLSHQREKQNATRIALLVELAELRGQSLDQVMTDLKLSPKPLV